MPRPAAEFLTEREAQIMQVLWHRGSASADEVRADLPGEPHDSTVRTLLRVLEAKGYVTHDAKGKSYIYRPAIERAQAQRSAVRSFLSRLFGGSAESLVLRLIEDDVLTPDQLDQIRRAAQPRAPSRPPKRRKGGSS